MRAAAAETRGRKVGGVMVRRHALLTVPYDVLIEALENVIKRELDRGILPEDTKIIAVQSDISRTSVELLLQSACFAPVPDGERITNLGRCRRAQRRE